MTTIISGDGTITGLTATGISAVQNLPATGTITNLTTTTISDGTNSTSSTNCIQGSAKAWCNYNGTNGTIRGSYNVASVTKNGTGNYTFNFTNAMPNENYSAVASFNRNYNSSDGYGMGLFVPTRTTTNTKIYVIYSNGAFYDQEYVGLTVNSN